MTLFAGLTVTIWAGWCLWLVFVDVRTRILPNRIILAGLVASATSWQIAEANHGWGVGLLESLATLAAIFLFYLAIALVSNGAFGMGDVKFAPLCYLVPAILGWQTAFAAVLISFATASLTGLYALARGKSLREFKVPFGPFMLLGSLVSIFVI